MPELQKICDVAENLHITDPLLLFQFLNPRKRALGWLESNWRQTRDVWRKVYRCVACGEIVAKESVTRGFRPTGGSHKKCQDHILECSEIAKYVVGSLQGRDAAKRAGDNADLAIPQIEEELDIATPIRDQHGSIYNSPREAAIRLGLNVSDVEANLRNGSGLTQGYQFSWSDLTRSEYLAILPRY